MCPYRVWFATYEFVGRGIIVMDNDTQCNVTGVGTVQIKTHDGVIKTL